MSTFFLNTLFLWRREPVGEDEIERNRFGIGLFLVRPAPDFRSMRPVARVVITHLFGHGGPLVRLRFPPAPGRGRRAA